MSTPLRSLEDLGLVPSHRGKVRETIDLGDRLLMVTTDRLSAFDCILPDPLPGKGVLLNQLSAFWLRGLSRLEPTHFLSTDLADLPAAFTSVSDHLRGRFLLARKAERVPVECVVRGYLAGGGWSEYQETGAISGERLPAGLSKFARLPEPIFTPTTKEDSGHDLPLPRAGLVARVGAETAALLERRSIDLYRRADRYARARGVVIADTKFEFGWIDGALALIDEALTPDSSRFWPIASAERAARGGGPPESWDKQFIRDYLLTLDWNRTPPAPALPAEVAVEALDRYRRAFDALTGGAREPDPTFAAP